MCALLCLFDNERDGSSVRPASTNITLSSSVLISASSCSAPAAVPPPPFSPAHRVSVSSTTTTTGSSSRFFEDMSHESTCSTPIHPNSSEATSPRSPHLLRTCERTARYTRRLSLLQKNQCRRTTLLDSRTLSVRDRDSLYYFYI